MTYLEQAEQLVRRHIPELADKDSGRPTGSGYIDYPPIGLQHYLRVLGDSQGQERVGVDGTGQCVVRPTYETRARGDVCFNFDLTTGAPANEDECRKFLELVK